MSHVILNYLNNLLIRISIGEKSKELLKIEMTKIKLLISKSLKMF